MSTQADQFGVRMIVVGRAYVRIIEVADLLLDRQPVWTERLLCDWCGRCIPIGYVG